MSRFFTSRSGLSLALIGLMTVGCGNPSQEASSQEREVPELGAVHFAASCSEDVAADFDGAVAFLHHMQYEESRAAFEKITRDDPSCAMGHWGVAMTLFQPLWPERPTAEALERGWAEAQRAQELAPATDREANLVAAVGEFFREPESADWWTRIGRWSDAMQEAYEASPDDIETAAFYALSQLAAGQIADDRLAYQGRAADVLLSIYEREPTHPGALHYTIHANDNDTRANESLGLVRSYDDIAPAVPHALHMPTHIFVRLGDWPSVIEWNRKSADAALNYPAGDRISHHYPHALDYLVYAYLQRGEDGRALTILDEVSGQAQPFQGSFISAFHLAAMPARYAVERRDWARASAIDPATPSSVQWERFRWAESMSWFARGLGAARSGDTDEASRAQNRMIELRDAASSAGEQAFATYIEVDRLLLAAWIASAQGQESLALELARESASLEATTQKHPVTPGSLYPPQEALGDLLLQFGRPQEAQNAYESSLAIWPGRFNSLAGAARSARASGQDDLAREYYRTLLETAAEAQSDRPDIEEARDYLGA